MMTIANIKVSMRTKPGAEPMWLMLSLMSLMKRLPRSGKKVVVEEVVAGSSHRSMLLKNLIAPLPYRIRREGFSETCSPVDLVRGGRDGVTGGSSSKGTTVGVRVEQM